MKPRADEFRDASFAELVEFDECIQINQGPVFETDPKAPAPRADDGKLLRAEHHAPDGPSAIAHEACLLPWVMGSLAVLGMVAVAIALGYDGNWRAALLGEVWLLMGYAVSWIVVWGAGLMRAKDEREIEEHIIQDELFASRSLQ